MIQGLVWFERLRHPIQGRRGVNIAPPCSRGRRSERCVANRPPARVKFTSGASPSPSSATTPLRGASGLAWIRRQTSARADRERPAAFAVAAEDRAQPRRGPRTPSAAATPTGASSFAWSRPPPPAPLWHRTPDAAARARAPHWGQEPPRREP
jgi:hypothetical protein